MRELRLLPPANDLQHGEFLVLASVEDDERFTLPVGDELRAVLGRPLAPDAVPGAVLDTAPDTATGASGGHPADAASDASLKPRPAPTPHTGSHVTPESPATPAEAPVELSPREIQVRIRAGESPEELATSCGVPVGKVIRFAEPVVAERLRIADEARRARAHRTSVGSDSHTVVFGDAVDDRFAAHGITPSDVAWNSYRREDGEWVIVAEWLGGEGRHDAEWLFHRSTRSVTPVDPTAVDLLSDRPIRPVAPPPPAPLRAAPPLAPGVVAFPSSLTDAHTAPMPAVIDRAVNRAVEEVFDQERAETTPAAAGPATHAAGDAQDGDAARRTPRRARRGRKQHAPVDEAAPSAVDVPARATDTAVAAPTGEPSLFDDALLPLSIEPTAPIVPEMPSAPAVVDERPVEPTSTGRALRAVSPIGESTPDPAAHSPAPATAPAASRPVPAAVAGGQRRAEGQRGGRVKVPAWDDILLGVRRKDD